MSPEQQQSSQYAPHHTQPQRPAEATYPSTWTSSQPPQRYESTVPTPATLTVVTMNVYAVPCAYTVNNEPLYLQYGSHSAAEAAQSAAFLGQRYWHLKNQPAAREDYAYSPAAVNRSSRAYDQTAPTNDHYDPYESRSFARPQATYEYHYPCSDPQARARDFDTPTPRSTTGHGIQQQPQPQPQRAFPEPEVARSVVPDIPRHPTVSRNDFNEQQQAGPLVQTTQVNRNDNCEAEDRCSGRNGRNGPHRGADIGVSKEQSSHHDSNNVHDGSHRRMSIPDISHPNETSVKTAGGEDSDRPSRSKGSKRHSEANSNETERRTKRTRLHWTSELHESFLAAVHKLGVEKAVPTSIIREMGVVGLSRENVASHLQKHRSSLRKERDDAEKKELVETLKAFMQNDPSNPRKNLSDEDVLKEAAARQQFRRHEITETPQVQIRGKSSHTGKHHVSSKGSREQSKAS